MGMSTARSWAVLFLAGVAGAALAQQSTPQSLSLNEALELARENNGTVRSAFLNYEAAKASARGAYAAFLPTIEGSIGQVETQLDTFTGPFRGVDRGTTRDALVDVNWKLFESGTRDLNYRQALLNRDASEFTSLQTLRSTLFSVHQAFYESLRAQELVRVQQQTLDRAQKLYDETEFRSRPDIGDLPRKDLKQAEADLLNAKVSLLTAKNRLQTADANLKAILGLNFTSKPQAEAPQEAAPPELTFSLEEAVARGLENRADLRADRIRVKNQVLAVNAAKLDGGLQWSVDARYQRSFAEDPFGRASIGLTASYPLYDGRRSRENIRVEQLSLEAQEATLTQNEREVTAEIESAYNEYSQNVLRLQAARSAVEAARENYEAAQQSFNLGASDLIEVITAQVTLATAESNYVEAVYDSYISDVRLRLAMGEPMPGEAS